VACPSRTKSGEVANENIRRSTFDIELPLDDNLTVQILNVWMLEVGRFVREKTLQLERTLTDAARGRRECDYA